MGCILKVRPQTTSGAGLDVPTTVALSGSVAWVVEGQLDHYFQPDDAGRPDIFRIQPVPLR